MKESGTMEALLRLVADGQLSIEDAAARIRGTEFSQTMGDACVDHDREARCGMPEVVFALRKTPEQVVTIMEEVYRTSGRALATRCQPEAVERLKERWPACRYYDKSQAVLVGSPQAAVCPHGMPLVISAGTSDGAVAEEVVATLAFCGYEATWLQDIGVAGLHRLTSRLDVIRAAPVVIVVAGMEGALPSVVGGLIDAPVIAVPTSVGYGAAFGGVAALLGMLNACASGMGVVNIDNGFGAGALAVRMLRRMQ